MKFVLDTPSGRVAWDENDIEATPEAAKRIAAAWLMHSTSEFQYQLLHIPYPQLNDPTYFYLLVNSLWPDAKLVSGTAPYDLEVPEGAIDGGNAPGVFDDEMITKHAGPGDHPSGSPQTVHDPHKGGGAEEVEPPAKPPGRADFASYIKHWPGRDFDPAAETKTKATEAAVFARMQADPRWATARTEWSEIGWGSGATATGIEEAEALRDKWDELTTWYADLPEPPWSPWDLPDVDEAFIVMDSTDSLLYESVEEVEVGRIVESTMRAANQAYHPGERGGWKITAVDRETGMVTLTEQGGPLGPLLRESGSEGTIVAWPFHDAQLGNYWALGPKTVQVPFESLIVPEDTRTLVTGTNYDEIEADLSELRDEWSTFEAQYGGLNPIDYLDQEGHGLDETTQSTPDYLFTGDEAADSDAPDRIPYLFRELWADTAADDHMWAAALQHAAAEEFGIEFGFEDLYSSGHSTSMLEDAERVYENFGTVLRVWARAVYDETQADLAARGWDFVPLIRGMSVADLKTLTELPGEAGAGLWSFGKWDEIKNADLNPLSSWTVSPQTAKGFFGVKRFRMALRGWVPRQKVWGHSILGNGAMGEWEVIILGGTDSFDGEIFAVDLHPPIDAGGEGVIAARHLDEAIGELEPQEGYS